MNTALCLFCNNPEPKYKPQAKIDFICSQCVQMLLVPDQEDLNRAYKKSLSLSKCPGAESGDESLRAWKNEIQGKTIRLGLSFPVSDEKALPKIYLNKAKVVESFLIPEGIDGQRKPISKNRGRHINRKRIVRAVGDKKKRIGRS